MLKKWVRPAKKERWVWIFAILVMAVTTLPYLIGYGSQGDAWRFSGFVFGVSDGNSYIAKMLSGAAGDWLFRTPYTPFAQQGVLAFFPYMLLGKLTAPPGQHLQLVALFHLFRFLAGVLAILATYDFLSLFLKTTLGRRWGLALAVLGGGLGWVLILFGSPSLQGSLPLDFYSPESFGFLSLYGLPHLALARAMLLWSLGYLLRGGAGAPGPISIGPRSLISWLRFCDAPHDRRPALMAGLAWVIMGLAQPLNVVIAWILVGSMVAVQGLRFRFFMGKNGVPQWPEWSGFTRRVIWAVFISAPLVLYTVAAFSLDPFLRNWTAQNLILSPTPTHYLLAYGLLAPLVLFGLVALPRREVWLGWFPVVWLGLLPFLAYAPYNLQRRLPDGVWVAVVALAVAGMETWRERSPARAQLVGMAWTILAFPSTILLLIGGVNAAGFTAEPIFRAADQVRVFEHLAEQGQKDEIVIGDFETGNALPAWAPMRVVIGHGPESIRLATLTPQVERFYQVATAESDRIGLLKDLDIAYVFWGPAERNLGNWDPGQAPYLKKIVAEGEYQVYQVELDWD